jgi:hypothetical protein
MKHSMFKGHTSLSIIPPTSHGRHTTTVSNSYQSPLTEEITEILKHQHLVVLTMLPPFLQQ